MKEYVHIIEAVLMLEDKRKERVSKLEQLGEKAMNLTAEQKEMKMIYESDCFYFPTFSEEV